MSETFTITDILNSVSNTSVLFERIMNRRNEIDFPSVELSYYIDTNFNVIVVYDNKKLKFKGSNFEEIFVDFEIDNDIRLSVYIDREIYTYDYKNNIDSHLDPNDDHLMIDLYFPKNKKSILDGNFSDMELILRYGKIFQIDFLKIYKDELLSILNYAETKFIEVLNTL